MATHRIQIFGWPTTTDSSSNVFFEAASIKKTNDLYDNLVAVFNDTATKLSLRGRLDIPQNYVGSPVIRYIWTSTATTGNVVWDFDYTSIGGDNTESLDPNAHQESVTVTDAAPSTSQYRLSVSVALTAANLAAGDTMEFLLSRDGADGSDTMAAAAVLHDAFFEYADA